MNKKERHKQLEKLAGNAMGLALIDYLKEQKQQMIENAVWKSEEMDEVYGARFAVKRYEDLIKLLKRLDKDEKDERDRYD